MLLLMMLLSWAGLGSGKRGSSDAAVSRPGSRGSGAGELSSPDAQEAVGKLLSETSLRFRGELLSSFLKLGAEGLEDHQLGVVLFHLLTRELVG
jgi:hypothetical protein